MEEDPVYMLIHSVDPRKINVPLRAKFAKLTLSRKKDEQAEQGEQGEPQQMGKRDSGSRNLLSLLNDNIAPPVCVGATTSRSTIGSGPVLSSTQSDNVPFYVNPLLRSSSDGENDSDETQVNSALVPEFDDDSVEQQLSSEQSGFMQPLQVSEGFSQLPNRDTREVERQVDVLSQRLSILAVSNSVGSNCEPTLLVSTESQRMSSNLLTQRSLQKTANRNDAECILLSSDTDTDTESDGAITVSDSSASVYSLAVETAVDFDAVTSNIPHSGETVDALLPNTFSNEKADRMEAFLRDVSLQCKEMQLQNQGTVLGEMEELTLKKEVIKDTDKRAREMAIADTESMSSSDRLIEEEQEVVGRLSPRDKAMALTANDTMPMNESQSVCSTFGRHSEPMSLRPERVISIDNDSKRLAGNETEANTLVTSAEFNEESWANNTYLSRSGDNSIAVNESRHEIPEESVIISETSSEVVHSSACASEAEQSGGKCSKELVPSEQAITSEENSAGTVHSQLSQIQMDIGSINISAKINIKIQISQQADSENSEDADYNDDDDVDDDSSEPGSEDVGDGPDGCDNNADSNGTKSAKNSLAESTEVRSQSEQQRPQLSNDNDLVGKYTREDCHNSSYSSASEGGEEDEKFLTHAERLLNQLYGQSWKTPDVIRSLKRTTSDSKRSSSGGKSSSVSGTQQTPICATNAGGEVENNNKKIAVKADGVVDQSVLDDFSIFRRNIVRTNLDSTRFATPKVQTTTVRRHPLTEVPTSEPHQLIKGARKPTNAVFKVPQTEVKKRTVVKKTSGRSMQSRWRQLVDDEADSSGANASDDESVDRTDDSRGANDSADSESAHSWSQTSESSDSSAEISPPQRTKNTRKKANTTKKPHNRTRIEIERRSKETGALVYLDLSQEEVIVQEGTPDTSPANNDANFNTRLQHILSTCKPDEKPKLLPTTPTTGGKTKRKLFTPNFGVEEFECTGDDSRKLVTPKTFNDEGLLQDVDHGPVAGGFEVVNKHLEAIKRGTPIFKLTPPRNISTPNRVTPARPKTVDDETAKRTPHSSKSGKPNENTRLMDRLRETPHCKYGFLKSLDVRVAKSLCHPDALYYRENFRLRKEELTKIIYELYNEKLFDNKLCVPLVWNKKLCNTAGRCLNKKKLGIRSCVVELSEKVLTSADRLRCTLIHELCHAATWIFHGEGGHGTTWKQWACKANAVFPEIPKIGVCHQYDIEYKYTYKCTLCAAKSHAHSKSKKVENIRCAFCHGAIEIFLNKKDKDGNIMPTPVKEPTGFAKFVKDNYKQYKRPDLKHADVMKILSNEFAALKVAGNGN